MYEVHEYIYGWDDMLCSLSNLFGDRRDDYKIIKRYIDICDIAAPTNSYSFGVADAANLFIKVFENQPIVDGKALIDFCKNNVYYKSAFKHRLHSTRTN